MNQQTRTQATARELSIRDALEHEAAELTELAIASKAHWGYPDDFMQACRDELTVSSLAIRDGHVVVADDGAVVGFYMLAPLDPGVVELDALFVAPQHIGNGIGRRLMEHAKRSAQDAGAHRLVIQGDPHATGFYLRSGAVQVGERESQSIAGRALPLFEIDLPKP